MKNRLFLIIAAVAVATVMVFASAHAADKPLPDLKLDNIKINVYKELNRAGLAKKLGVMESLGAEGQVLVKVDVNVMPQWTEEIKDARIDSEAIKLETDQGGILMSGYFRDYDEFEIGAQGWSSWRPSDWKEKPGGQRFMPVFMVPADLKSAKFVIGNVSADIRIPEPGPAPDPAKDLAIQVVSTKFVDSIRSEKSVGNIKPKPATIITGGGQKLLEMRIKVTPNRANTKDGKRFYFNSNMIGLVLDGGLYVPSLGQISWDQLNQQVSHTVSKNGDAFKTDESSIFFAVPQDAGAYKLTYRSVVVAEGGIGGASTPAKTPEKKAEPEEEPEEKPKEPVNKGKETIKNLMKGIKTN